MASVKAQHLVITAVVALVVVVVAQKTGILQKI